jgi:hypothetical protein
VAAKKDSFDAKQYRRSKATEKLIEEAKQLETAPKKTRAGHLPGFLLIPVSIKARLNGVSGPALQVLCCLLELEHETKVKNQPLSLPNAPAKKWGLSRGQKLRGLKELEKRGVLTFTQYGKASPRALIYPDLMR